jgi:hypothetical protein
MGFQAKKTTRVIFPLKKHTRAVLLLYASGAWSQMEKYSLLDYIPTLDDRPSPSNPASRIIATLCAYTIIVVAMVPDLDVEIGLKE